MTTIVGVKFKAAGKVYYFDPGEFDLNTGSHIIVETARGFEFGEVTIPTCQVNDLSVYKPLKKVVRIASEEDEKSISKIWAENRMLWNSAEGA